MWVAMAPRGAFGFKADRVIGILSLPNSKLDRSTHSSSSTAVTSTNSDEPSATQRLTTPQKDS